MAQLTHTPGRPKLLRIIGRLTATLLMHAMNEFTDRLTGRTVTLQEKRPRQRFDDTFTYLFSRGASKLAVADMKSRDWQLMFRLVGVPGERLDFQVFRDVDQYKMADNVGCSQATISRALKRLCELGVVERENRGGGGRASRYRLSPEFFWRGTAGQYHAARGKRTKAKNAQRAVAAMIERTNTSDDQDEQIDLEEAIDAIETIHQVEGD